MEKAEVIARRKFDTMKINLHQMGADRNILKRVILSTGSVHGQQHQSHINETKYSG